MVDGRSTKGHCGTMGAVLVCLAAVLPGCGASRTAQLGPAERLSPDDFHRPATDAPAPLSPIPPFRQEKPRAPRVEIRSLTEAQAKGGVSGIDVEAGAPPPAPGAEVEPAPTPAPGPTGTDGSDLVLVDSKVGDLNGWPVLARSWLEPMGARLKAESAGKSREAWRGFAADAIRKRLEADLSDELFLAEARSTLTAEEKVGLRVFLQRFEQDVVRSSYGSPTLAEERLRETAGMGLVEAKRERERTALIENEVRTKVYDRVQVSSRDLRLEYERRFEEYNPPPTAVFRTIRVRTGEAETVAAFTEMLATRPFGEVADDPRNGTREPDRRKVPEGLAKAELYGIPALQEAAAGLTPGAFAGPLDLGTFTWWVYLDRIESETRSLYDVQLELRDQITAARRNEETYRYLLRLFHRAGISGLNDLTLRLVEIAERWYYEPGAG